MEHLDANLEMKMISNKMWVEYIYDSVLVVIITETRPTVLHCQAPYKVVGIRY